MAVVMRYGQGPFDPVYLPRWEFIEGGRVSLADGEGTVLTPPTTDPVTNILELSIDGGPITYGINSALPSINSGGLINTDGMETIGPLHNFQRVAIYADDAAVVHYQWFREHD